jgi:hypothetical protein
MNVSRHGIDGFPVVYAISEFQVPDATCELSQLSISRNCDVLLQALQESC